MGLLATVVNTHELLMTVAAAFVSALAVALAASVGIWGVTKYIDFHQDGRAVLSVLALGLGVIGLLAMITIMALGIFLMVAA